MTDRELLELAAKAAGVDLGSWCKELDAFWKGGRGESTWNPLTDYGDALRLAMKLRLCVKFDFDRVVVTALDRPVGTTEFLYEKPKSTYPLAATRRAIVRAAAEIGRNMEPTTSGFTEAEVRHPAHACSERCTQGSDRQVGGGEVMRPKTHHEFSPVGFGLAPTKREGDIVDPDSLTWECEVETCTHCREFYNLWKQKYKEQEEK